MLFLKSFLCIVFIVICIYLFPSCGGGDDEETQDETEVIVYNISPLSAVAGNPGFRITVQGAGFVPESSLQWNGQDRPTTVVGSTHLYAEIDAQDIDSAGNNNISIHNPSPNEGVSEPITFIVSSNDENWMFLGTPTDGFTKYYDVSQLLVDSEDDRIFYVTLFSKGLFISRDRGRSWEEAVQAKSAGVVTQDSDNPDRLFYGQRNNLYISVDRGLTWELNHSFDEEISITTITLSKFSPGTIYVTGSGSNVMFQRSQDDGFSWQSYSYGQTVGIDNFIPWALAEDAVDGTLYVGVELGNHPQPYYPPFLRSMDGGETWINLVEGMTSIYDGPIWHVTSIDVDPDNGKVYAIPEGAGLSTSLDQGMTWSFTQDFQLVDNLVRDPWQEGRLFVGGNRASNEGGGVYISEDDGEHFYRYGLEGHTIGSLCMSRNGEYLYAAAYGAGLYYTILP